jgi:hypothetical protein
MASWKRILLFVVATWILSVGTVWMTRWAGGISDQAMVDAMVQMSFAQRGAAPSGEQSAQMASMMTPFIRAYPIVIPVNLTLWMLVVGTIFFVALKMIDGAPTWLTVFEATAIAAACQAAAMLVLTGMASMSQAPTASELLSGRFVVSNAASLLPEDTSLLLVVLARRLDVLTMVFLIVLGVTLVDRMPPKTSRGAVAGVIVGCWALWISASLMMAMVMPSMMR